MGQPLDRLRAALSDVAGVVEGESQFGHTLAFWCNGKEIAHFEADGIELRLTRALISEQRAELRADPRVTLRKGTSDWLEVAVSGPEDVDFAIALFGRAADAHRAPPGATAAPPPTDRDLARRRRFH